MKKVYLILLLQFLVFGTTGGRAESWPHWVWATAYPLEGVGEGVRVLAGGEAAHQRVVPARGGLADVDHEPQPRRVAKHGMVMALTGVLNLFAFALAAFGFGLLGMIHQLQRADRTEL